MNIITEILACGFVCIYLFKNGITLTEKEFAEYIDDNGGVYVDHLLFRSNGKFYLFVKSKQYYHEDCPVDYSTFRYDNDEWFRTELLVNWRSTSRMNEYYYGKMEIQCINRSKFVEEFRTSVRHRMHIARLLYLDGNNGFRTLPFEIRRLIEQLLVPLTKQYFTMINR